MNVLLRDLHIALRKEFGADALLLSISHRSLNEVLGRQFKEIQASSVLIYEPYQTSHSKISVNLRADPGWTISDIDANSRFKVSGNLNLDFMADLGINGQSLIQTRIVTVHDFELVIVGDQNSESGVSIRPSLQHSRAIYSDKSKSNAPSIDALAQITLEETEYLILVEAFLMVSVPNIAGSLSAMFNIPPFRKLLVAVDFIGELKVSSYLDRLVISGKPSFIAKDSCSYNGSGQRYEVNSLPDDKAEVEICGVEITELVGEIVVSYPKEVFQTVLDMKASVRPSVRDWCDYSDTIHYVQWDASLALASAKISFDTGTLKISIGTVFEPSGHGQAGTVFFGCDGTRMKLVSLTIDPTSTIDSTLTALPCINDKHVFLRVIWATETTLPLRFSLDVAPPGPLRKLIETLVGDKLSQKLSDSVRDKASQTLEFPLIALDSLISPLHGMKKDDDKYEDSFIRSIQKDLLENSILLSLSPRPARPARSKL